MTFDDLRVFVAVCEAESLSSVARDLGCTQSAVSQHIRRLERECGTDLLERHPKGVVPTEAGRILHAAASEGLDSIGTAVRRIEQIRDGHAGSLGISTGGTTVKHFMRPAIVSFRKRYPRITLDFQSANSTRRCIEAVHRQKADLAFITMGSDIEGVEQVPVVEMPWTLVVRAQDDLAARKTIRLGDLSGVRYISLPEHSASQLQLEAALGEEGLTLDSSTSVDDWDTAILLVELGLGQAIAPAVHAREFTRDGTVRAIPIEGLPPVAFGWAARRWSSLGRVALDFADIVAKELAKVRGVPGLRVVA